MAPWYKLYPIAKANTCPVFFTFESVLSLHSYTVQCNTQWGFTVHMCVYVCILSVMQYGNDFVADLFSEILIIDCQFMAVKIRSDTLQNFKHE